ncbi:MAG TPA: tetratricopeptide repeat protein [Acidimicrobiales bacterium]|nr:tetratricopeptide repeat protein [Acidimicrobiales bacterium]
MAAAARVMASAFTDKDDAPVLPHALAAASHGYRLGVEPAAVASIWGLAAAHYLDIGDPRTARDLLTPTLQLRQQLNGEDSPEVAPTLGNLGNAELALGDPAAARALHRRALAI